MKVHWEGVVLGLLFGLHLVWAWSGDAYWNDRYSGDGISYDTSKNNTIQGLNRYVL